ncbi:UvrB/UvrC motif-containing protein [Neobacillus niacini]|uniref:UvrB/UvrC motif-containing protein n=1 Tax=Neobacillus niacini TaxID=86668 RepID=UPI003983C4D3
MKDYHGTIIYVGKAKNLKRRVQSYFQHSKAHPQKIIKMVSNITDFDFILTDTEFEAFMLECKLIREIKPLFNKMMKSPQSYSYIVIDRNKKIRTIEITNNRMEQDGRLYFGPYPSRARVQQAIMGIKEFYKILCTNSQKSSPCLNYSLGLCMGICCGGPAIAEYHSILDNIAALLSGENKGILEELKQRMDDASKNFDFEAAAKYRDKIEAITFLLKKEKVIEFTEKSRNVAVIESLNEQTFKLFLIKRNKILFSKKFDDGTSIEQLASLMISCFQNTSIRFIKELDREEIDEAQIIYNYLKSSKCAYKTIPETWIRKRQDKDIEKAIVNLIDKKQILTK